MAKLFEIAEVPAVEPDAIRIAIHWPTGPNSGKRE